MNLSAVRLRVCDQCSQIKQRCDGADPCHRCARLSLDCKHSTVRRASHYERGVAKIPSYAPFGPNYDSESFERNPKRRAAVIKRTRNGCTSCKIRKKKCDEAHPKCGDCKRLNLNCSLTSTNNSASPILKVDRISRPISQNWLSDISDALVYTERQLSPVVQVESIGEENTSTPYYSDETGSITYSNTPAIRQYESPLSIICSQSPFQHLKSIDQHLLRHFIRVVSRTLSVVHEDDLNPFLNLIVPLAGSSKVVQESLLALSACHLRRIYPEVLQRGLSHQNEALASLSNLIGTKSPNSSEETLAAILLLCMIEICDGNSTKWSWHIQAAQTIIRSKQKDLGCNSSTWRFLLAVFGYVDSVITISKCQAPLISPEELVGDRDTSSNIESSQRPLTPISKSHNEALFGIALPLFTLIGQISELAHRRKDRVDEISELWFRQSATRIQTSLRSWKPDLHTSKGIGSHTSQDLIDAAYAIQWASILRLHQVVEGYNRSDYDVVESTAKILEHISRIRFGSPAESILIFPLVMAGSGCQDKEQRMMVRERWMVMERTIGFDNIYRARQMVEAVWKEVDEGQIDGTNAGGLKVNWARIRYYDFPGVVLL